MEDLLINSGRDITILTCKEKAREIFLELVDKDYEFVQGQLQIIEEINTTKDIIEITKLVSESNEVDNFFIFKMGKEEDLVDRDIIIDSCVKKLVDIDSLPDSSDISIFNDTEEECCCDECMAVKEILDMEDLSFEEALREVYRLAIRNILLRYYE